MKVKVTNGIPEIDVNGKVYIPIQKKIKSIGYINRYQKDHDITTITFEDNSFTHIPMNTMLNVEI